MQTVGGWIFFRLPVSKILVPLLWLTNMNVDEEMRVLSKCFGIHPLTAEDIQMEETREKIELFRNYYLVCFRSFDQNQYSPTYLEPINYYVVVFREGILSVSRSFSRVPKRPMNFGYHSSISVTLLIRKMYADGSSSSRTISP